MASDHDIIALDHESLPRRGRPHPITLGTAAGYAVIALAPISKTLDEGGYEVDRCYVAGTRMFHVAAIGPNTPAMKADAQRFVASFALR